MKRKCVTSFPRVPHLQELFPHVLALLPGFVQRPLVVERGGLVRSLRQVFEESQPAEMLHALRTGGGGKTTITEG